MYKILIAIPTFENVATETFESIFNLEKIQGVKTDLRFVKGYDCAKARNSIAKISQNEKYDYVLMVDSDVVLPSNTLERLVHWIDLDFVMGYYPRKDEPDSSEVYKLGWGYPIKNRLSISELKNSEADLIRIQGGGFGCAFMKVSMFDKLKYPYFKYVEYDNGDCLSEDLYFCEEAVKASFKLYVDPKLACSHVKKTIIKC